MRPSKNALVLAIWLVLAAERGAPPGTSPGITSKRFSPGGCVLWLTPAGWYCWLAELL
jgi:hypothetical protein